MTTGDGDGDGKPTRMQPRRASAQFYSIDAGIDSRENASGTSSRRSRTEGKA